MSDEIPIEPEPDLMMITVFVQSATLLASVKIGMDKNKPFKWSYLKRQVLDNRQVKKQIQDQALNLQGLRMVQYNGEDMGDDDLIPVADGDIECTVWLPMPPPPTVG
mmetsp:Transcript_74569/g.193869  ORF Transcript_74569/g.193869 Transcript_74569/m.193869 type:complete len:107 (-) Transcript_74569:250-570(-)